jgi:Uma2 family endonuclease
MSVLVTPAMSLASTPVPRLFTAADLAALPDELPSGPVQYELDDGRIIFMPSPGDVHSAVSSNVVAHLKVQGEWVGHGKARDAVSVILRRNPDRVVGTDGCFMANASLPQKLSPEGYLETVPDLVVEVRSKHDSVAELERKAGEYVAAGTKLVWVIDPIRSVAVVYQAGHAPRTLEPADELTAEGIIPGFRLSVGDALRV